MTLSERICRNIVGLPISTACRVPRNPTGTAGNLQLGIYKAKVLLLITANLFSQIDSHQF